MVLPDPVPKAGCEPEKEFKVEQAKKRKFTKVHSVAAVAVVAVSILGGYEVLCQLEGRSVTANAAGEQPRSLMAEGVACLLPHDEMAQRQAQYERDVVPLVTGLTRGEDRLHFVLKGTPEATRTIAERMAALEAGCCSFMTIRYADDIAPTAIEIQAPANILDQMQRILSAHLATTDDRAAA